YYPVIPASDMDRFAAIFRDSDAELPESDEEAPDFATPDEMVAARVDCARWVDQKYAALGAHGSQSDNVFFLRLGRESFAKVFSTECFVRAYDSTKAPTPEDDLFAGLR
ncbi:MAG: PIG-L family deacetylase, partial [Acidimicrobiales bacterium]